MNDKKETLNRYALNEVNDLSPEYKEEAFPTRLKGYCTFLSVEINDVIMAYLCMDIVPGTAFLHLNILPEHRSYSTVMQCKSVFYELVHPWCRSKGCEAVVVSCEATDVKTTELFKTFDFNPQTINIATMRIRED